MQQIILIYYTFLFQFEKFNSDSNDVLTSLFVILAWIFSKAMVKRKNKCNEDVTYFFQPTMGCTTHMVSARGASQEYPTYLHIAVPKRLSDLVIRSLLQNMTILEQTD